MSGIASIPSYGLPGSALESAPPWLRRLAEGIHARAGVIAHWSALTTLFVLIACTFRPALEHAPREDQWAYLLDTVHEERFLPLVLQTYSYNRTRLIDPGDYPLFRPALFTMLAAEKALFGHRYQFWQMTGIALHCGVVWLLLTILLRLNQLFPCPLPVLARLRTGLAYVLAGFFGLNFAVTEMVVWCHIHGYMLYTLCLLGALLLSLDELCGEGSRGWQLWRLAATVVLIAVASMAYETGCVFAGLLGFALALVAVQRRQFVRAAVLLVLFSSLCGGYFLADKVDQQAHPHTIPDWTRTRVLEHAQLKPTLEHSGRYLLYTLIQPFFPSSMRWNYCSRLIILEPKDAVSRYFRLNTHVALSWLTILLAVCLAIWQLGRLLVARPADSPRRVSGVLLVLVLFGIIGMHMAVIVLGRMNIREGSKSLAWNSYYTYMPLLALLVGLYYLWLRLPPARPSWLAAALTVVMVGLVSMTWVSARKAHAMADHIADEQRTLHKQMALMQNLIDRHRHEPGFGVSFEPRLYRSLRGFHGVSKMEILYGKHINHDRPSHVVFAEGERWYVVPATARQWRDVKPSHPLPTFLQAGTDYNVVRQGTRYFGVYHRGPNFVDRHGDYPYLIEGRSAEEVTAQIPRMLLLIDADRQAGKPMPGE